MVNFEVKSKEQVDADLMKALLARALWERQEQEFNQLQSEANQDVQLAEHVHKRRSSALTFIHKRIKRAKIHSFVHQTLPVAGRAAAAALLVFFLTLSTALAVVPEVRIRVLELLMNVKKEYTELSMQEKPDASFAVPPEWLGDYYPSKLPQGYAVNQVIGDELAVSYCISFWNAANERIFFYELDEHTVSNINTEDADIEYRMIHGRPGMISRRKDQVIVTWSENNRYFIMTFDNVSEDALAIAEGVIRIK